MMPESQLAMATTTVSTADQAEQMAAHVVASGLAACAQIDGPIRSHYTWDGQAEAATEWRLTFKTTGPRLAELAELVHQLHPYELPQWIVVSAADASAGYARWVADSVRGGPEHA
jgi:periplasmic divalent cation tolerance protein